MRSANFVEETTTSIAGTAGNGAITLTAIASTPRFSTVFGTQATTIRYVIEDTVGKRFETGIGSVASNVLTRTRPQVTWDGTTYDDSTPAPIAFGSAPASGNIKVRLSATAESQGVVLPGTNATVGGLNGYEMSADITTAGNPPAHVMTVNREYYIPYLLPGAGLLTGAEIEVRTAAAGAFVKMALYGCGANGLPSGKIADFNIFDASTTGLKEDSATSTWSPVGPVALVAGWYFVGMIASAGAVALRAFGTNQRVQRNPLGRQGNYGYAACAFASGSYATGLPASPVPTSLLGQADAQGFVPRLRVAA